MSTKVGTPPRVFRDTARLAVALLLFRDMVMRPRKGYFSVLFVKCAAFEVFILLFRFRGTAPTDPHQKLKSSPAFSRLRDSKGQSPLVALARAKLRKPQLKIRSHKEKQNYQPQHGTHIARCTAQSRKSKSRMQKRNSRPAIPHRKRKKCRESILHAALTENSRP